MNLCRSTTTTSWALALVMLWALAAGFCGSLSLPQKLPTLASAPGVESEEEHRKHCHCLNCPGASLCCCSKVAPSVSTSVIQPLCDQGTTLALSAVAAFTLPTVVLALPVPLVSVLARPSLAPRVLSAPRREPSPLAPPPRPLS